MKSLICIWIALCFIGCGNSEKKEVLELVKEWNGKEILFPTESFTTVLGKDTFMMEENPEYKVVVYTDSVGCTSCKLQLHRWMELMHEVDSLAKGRVSFLFYFYSERKNESNDIFHRFNFVYPVYWDEKNEFYRLNRFPSDITFQTFLLDKNNKIIAIGNPVHNPKIKDLYMNIIQGKAASESEGIRTKINIKSTDLSLGAFDWQQEQTVEFILENTGERLLVINDVLTSCDCTTVGYSKEPVHPKDSVALSVTYMAEQPGRFDKIIKVYCNADSSPILLRITGEAK